MINERSQSSRPTVACAGAPGLGQRDHSNHPAARSAFATKGNMNADGPEECLAATQPTSQGAWISWPSPDSVRHIFACCNTGAQKIGGRSRPCAASGHDFPHKSGHGVGLNDAFDRGSTVGIIDAQKGTRRPKRRFTGGCPQREISHARRAFKPNARQPPQPMDRSAKQSAEDPRPHHFELAPKLALRAAALIRYWFQGKKDRSVSQI
jgi:hypothetical protein